MSFRSSLENGLSLAGLSLDENQLQACELYAGELIRWNQNINLTAITDNDEIAIKHFIDSFIFASMINKGEHVLDVGSGAGFPGIPLKIMQPSTSVVSVDAAAKKIVFQRSIGRLLRLHDFEADQARVEHLSYRYATYFNVIVSRAFSRLDLFVSFALPLLAAEGRIIALKGPDGRREAEESRDALAVLNCAVTQIIEYGLPLEMGLRSMIIVAAL